MFKLAVLINLLLKSLFFVCNEVEARPPSGVQRIIGGHHANHGKCRGHLGNWKSRIRFGVFGKLQWVMWWNTNFCQLLSFSKQNFLLMKFSTLFYKNIWYSHQQHEIFDSLMMQNLKHLEYCWHTTNFLGTLNNVHLKFTFTKMLELWIILFLQYFKVQS